MEHRGESETELGLREWKTGGFKKHCVLERIELAHKEKLPDGGERCKVRRNTNNLAPGVLMAMS